MIDINELRRLAQAATPGPDGLSLSWIKLLQDFQQGANPATVIELLDRLEAAESARRDDYQNWMTALDRNAELLAKLEAAEKELAELRSSMKFRTSLIGRTEAERDALRAKVEQMERQEPVAFALYSGWAFKAAYHKEHEACDQRDRRQLSADLGGSLEAYRVVPLYALPGAKGEEK